MPVGDFARAVLEQGIAAGLPLREGTSLAWLSGRGHLEPAAGSATENIRGRLAAIHRELGGDAELLGSKRASHPKVDALLGDSVSVEVDEFQHFTMARLHSLAHYGGFKAGFDMETYRDLCREHAPRADAYRRAKTATDFPFPGGRTAQRAYLDAVRDLLGPAHGWAVMRIAAPDNDLDAAVRDLLRAAERMGV